MIDKDTMMVQANLKVKNAPNKDWQNRGTLTLSGKLEEHDICNYDKKIFGKATVGFYKFEMPEVKSQFDIDDSNNSKFIGFTIAVAKIGRKIISETSPVIGQLDSNDNYNKMRGTASFLARRFCPQCNSIDSVKQRTRRAGPECVHITYYCKCGFLDHDVMD